jgi:hypothetical protein
MRTRRDLGLCHGTLDEVGGGRSIFSPAGGLSRAATFHAYIELFGP